MLEAEAYSLDAKRRSDGVGSSLQGELGHQSFVAGWEAKSNDAAPLLAGDVRWHSTSEAAPLAVAATKPTEGAHLTKEKLRTDQHTRQRAAADAESLSNGVSSRIIRCKPRQEAAFDHRARFDAWIAYIAHRTPQARERSTAKCYSMCPRSAWWKCSAACPPETFSVCRASTERFGMSLGSGKSGSLACPRSSDCV